MKPRIAIILLAAVLTLLGLGITASADELRIKVLDNQEFKIEGNSVRIVGKLEITKGDLYLTAGEILYNSEAKTATITGEPYLKTSDATVDGQMIEADFDQETFVITGSVRIKQAKRVALADEVHVDNAAETYLLLGNVLVTEEQDKKELRGEEVLIDSKADVVEVRGPVEVSFTLEEEETSTEAPTEVTSSQEIYVQVESVPAEQR